MSIKSKERLSAVENELLLTPEEMIGEAKQALEIINFLKLFDDGKTLTFNPNKPGVANIPEQCQFIIGSNDIRVAKSHEEPVGIWIDMHRADGDVATDKASHYKKGAAKKISLIVKDDQVDIATNFLDGLDGSANVVTSKRKHPKLPNWNWLNPEIQVDSYPDPESDLPKLAADFDQNVKAQRILLGLNNQLAHELVQSGKFDEYVKTKLMEAGEKEFEQEIPETQTPESEEATQEETTIEEGSTETRLLTIEDIIKSINDEQDPLKKVELIAHYSELIEKNIQSEFALIPEDLQRDDAELSMALRVIQKVTGINQTEGERTYYAYYASRKTNLASYDAQIAVGDPEEIFGKKWKLEMTKIAHPDQYAKLYDEIRPSKETLEEINVCSGQISQVITASDKNKDSVALGMLMRKLFTLTCDQRALNVYEKIIPLFEEKINSGIAVVTQKMDYLVSVREQTLSLKSNSHPLQKANVEMRDTLKQLVKVEEQK